MTTTTSKLLTEIMRRRRSWALSILLVLAAAEPVSAQDVVSCFIDVANQYVAAEVDASATATPSGASIDLTNTFVDVTIPASLMLDVYNDYGLLAAGANSVILNISATIHAQNALPSSIPHIATGLVGMVEIADADGVPDTGDETATDLHVSLSVPDSSWGVANAGGMHFSVRTVTATVQFPVGGFGPVAIGPCTDGVVFLSLFDRCVQDADCDPEYLECFEPSTCSQTACLAPANVPAGTTCGGNQVCDGAGSCVDCIDLSDCDTNECRGAPDCMASTCIEGAPLTQNTPCSAGVCDGAGNCVAATLVLPGTIGTLAGGGGLTQDGIPALFAQVSPFGMLPGSNSVIFADASHHKIRFVDYISGTIGTFYGTGASLPIASPGMPAANVVIHSPVDLAADDTGHLLILEGGSAKRLIRIDEMDRIQVVAGGGGTPVSSLGPISPVPATNVSFSAPAGVDVDDLGNIYVLDSGHRVVVRLTKTSAASWGAVRLAGGFSVGGDGLPANVAGFAYPTGIAVTDAGDVYITDAAEDRLRRVDAATGIIDTVAGGGSELGDGVGVALQLRAPAGATLDLHERVLFTTRERVRRYDPLLRTVTTLAGDYTQLPGFSGDGGDPLDARFNLPAQILEDDKGLVLVADTQNGRIRVFSECASDVECDSSPLACFAPSECSFNVCRPREITGEGCDGVCSPEGYCLPETGRVEKNMRVGCEMVAGTGPGGSPLTIALDAVLGVTPQGSIEGGQPFDVELDGTLFLPETLLDVLQELIPGGIRAAIVDQVSATVVPRSGAAGPPVSLTLPAPSGSCYLDGSACFPNDNLPDGSNSSCLPLGPENTCATFVRAEIDEDCFFCETLSAAKGQHCVDNGFCVTAPLRLPLVPATGSYVAEPAGAVLFGWADATSGATLEADRTYTLPTASLSLPVSTNGGLFGLPARGGLPEYDIGLACAMGVEASGPHGSGAFVGFSRTPDSELLRLPIEVAGQTCNDDSDCNSPTPADCRAPSVCLLGVCQLSIGAAPAGTPCGSAAVCNDSGTCVFHCENTLCDPTMPSQCREPKECVDNACDIGPNTPAGTPCNQGECDGAGSCQYICQDSDCAPQECYEAHICISNACTLQAPHPLGVACSIGQCDGLGDCDYVCQDSDCVATEECREDSRCSDNACLPNELSPEGTPCSIGQCDSWGACRPLCGGVLCDSSPVDCLEPSACIDDVCQPREPSAQLDLCADGQGACFDLGDGFGFRCALQCSGGASTCAPQDDCHHSSTCLGIACEPQELVPAGNGCSFDGGSMCNAQGQCVECISDANCALDECVAASSCVNGTCGAPTYEPDGTPCAGGYAACHGGVCTFECVVDQDCVPDGRECYEAICQASGCETRPLYTGAPCSAGLCDGLGNCGQAGPSDPVIVASQQTEVTLTRLLGPLSVAIGENPNLGTITLADLQGPNALTVYDNPLLTDLELSALQTVASLVIENNLNLANLTLGSLTSALIFDLVNNDALTLLDVPSLYSVDEFTVTENGSLIHVNAAILQEAEVIEVTNNDALTALDLGTLTEALEIIVANNSQLADVDLMALQSTETLQLVNLGHLQSATLNDLVSVTEELGVKDNPALSTLELGQLLSAGAMELVNNDVLTEIELINLQALGELVITDNDLIQSVVLGALTSLGKVTIRDNGSLAAIELGSVAISGDAEIEQVGATTVDYCGITVGGDLALTLEETFDVCAPIAAETTSIAMGDLDTIMSMSVPGGTFTADTSVTIHELNFAELAPTTGTDPAGDPVPIEPIVAHQFVFESPMLAGSALMGYTIDLAELPTQQERDSILGALATGNITVAVRDDAPNDLYEMIATCVPPQTAANFCVEVLAFDADGNSIAADGNPNTAEVKFSWTTDHFSTYALVLSGAEDSDDDGVVDAVDNCPEDANPDQRDYDLNGTGDVCDPACSILPGGQIWCPPPHPDCSVGPMKESSAPLLLLLGFMALAVRRIRYAGC